MPYSKQFDYISYMHFRYHTLFFKSLVFRGRKLWAFNFFIGLKYQLKLREKVNPFWVFLVALMKITPDFLLFPKKFAGRVSGVPLPISEVKQYTFATKWVIKLIKDKYDKVTIPLVADTLISAIYDKGIAMEKKRETYTEGFKNRHLIKYFK